jgi:phage shock protein A
MTRPSRRFRNLLSNALGSLMEPAEDPRRSEPDADPYQRQRLLLMQVHQALQDLETTRSRFMEQAATAWKQAQQLKDQAGDALKAGREDLARSALRRRAIVVAEIASLDQHIAQIQTEEERLSLLEQNLRSQIESLHARQQIAAARQTAAGAQVRIGEALYGVSDELLDVALELDRHEQDANILQARANAIADLAASGSLILSDPLQRGASGQIIPQPALAVDIESQLELLRQELASDNHPHADPPDNSQG